MSKWTGIAQAACACLLEVSAQGSLVFLNSQILFVIEVSVVLDAMSMAIGILTIGRGVIALTSAFCAAILSII